MSPRPSLRDERRPQILAAAARVIALRGVAQTRLSDVAEEAGLSIGVVQHYFGSREQLLAEAFRFEGEESTERVLEQMGAHEDGWARIVAIVDFLVPHDERSRVSWALWLEFWAEAGRDARVRRALEASYVRMRGVLRRAIGSGLESGVFHPASDVDDVIDRTMALIDGLAIQVVVASRGAVDDRRMRMLLVDALAGELRVRPVAAAPPVERA